MKGIVYFFSLFFILTDSVFAYNIKPMKLKRGDTFIYDITVLNAKVATQKIVVKGITNIDGLDCYFIYTRIKTTPLVSSIYKVDDRIYTYISTNNMLPVLIKTVINEGTWHNRITIIISHKNKTVRYLDNRIDKVYKFKDKFFGLVSVLFYIREITPEEDEEIKVTVHNKKKIVPLTARAKYLQKKKRFKINRKRKSYNIIRYKEINTDEAEIWITNDEYRLPVKLVSIKIPVFGKLFIELKNTLKFFHRGRR